MAQLLMPKATAVWLVENTTLTFEQIADGLEYKTPATIDDPAILAEITDALSGLGYARKD